MSAQIEDYEPAGMSAKEFAAACGVDLTTVYQWVWNDRVESIKRDRKLVILTNPADMEQRRRNRQARYRPSLNGQGLTVSQFAETLNVHRDTVDRMIRDGRIQSKRVGRLRVVLTDPADVKVRRQRQAPFVPERGLTVTDFSAACGVAQETVLNWITDGKVHTEKVGRRTVVLTDPADVPVYVRDTGPRGFTPGRGMTVQDYAAACEVTISTVMRWMESGKVEFEKVARRTVVLTPPPDPVVLREGLSTAEFAASCGVRPGTVSGWIQSGRLPAHRVGGRVLITEDPGGYRPQESPRPPSGYLSSREFARECGVDVSTVHKWAREGRLEYVTINGARYIAPDQVNGPVVGGPRTVLPGQSRPAPAGLSITEFARQSGRTPKTVRSWVDAGRLKVAQHGSRQRILTDPSQWRRTSSPATSRPKPTLPSRFVSGLSIAGFARAAGVSRQTVYNWANAGRITLVRHGTRQRVVTDPESVGSELPGMSVIEFAAAAGVTKVTVYKWAERSRVESAKHGGALRILSDPDEHRRR